MIIDDRGARISTNQFAYGAAWEPGIYVVKCRIYIAEHSLYLNVTRNVAVVGGPFKLEMIKTYVWDGEEQLPLTDNIPPEFDSDQDEALTDEASESDPKSPRYVQYFEQDSYPTSLAIWEQHPQHYGAFMPVQPEGTSMQWDLPDFVKQYDDWYETNVSVPLWANGVGLAGEVKVNLKIEFEGVLYEGFHDDTKDNPGKPHLVSAHMPGSMELFYDTAGLYLGGKAGTHAAKRHYLFQLKDTFGTGMPGVLIQERFTQLPLPYEPPNWVVNISGQGWASDWENDDPVLNLPGWPDHDQEVDLSNTPRGIFNGFDNLGLIWAVDLPGTQDDNWQKNSYTAIHQFYVGTWSVTSGGILISTYTMTFTKGPTVGSRGTVSHTGG